MALGVGFRVNLVAVGRRRATRDCRRRRCPAAAGGFAASVAVVAADSAWVAPAAGVSNARARARGCKCKPR